MSDLPTSWEAASLAAICERLVDGSHNPPPATETGRPMLSARNVNDFRVLFDDYRLISESAFELEDARTRVAPGDVLLTIVGTIGRTAVVSEHYPPFALQRSVAVLKPRGIDPRYLAYALNAPERQQWLIDNAKGTAQKGVYLKTLGSAEIPIAPVAEQTRIVAKLEELLSDLDAGVAELKAAQKKLAQYRQSLLKAAVEGALTADWRAKNTPTETGAQLLERILQERRARWEAKQLAKFESQGKAPPKGWQTKYPEPVQPDTTDLPELPQGWVWASGEQLCEFITKGTTPPKELDSGGLKTIPFLRVTNLTDRGELDLSDEVFVSVETHQGFLARSAVYPNDVLMNIVGPPLGQVAVVPSNFPEWNINQAIAIFRAVDGVLPSFICRYLLSPVAQQWLKARSKTTAGQTNLTLEVCRSLPIPLPPQLEQQALLADLDIALDSMSSQAHSIGLALKQSTAQRQNILRAAFAGQLVPQDPNDEPASVLLERIRAERAARDAVKKPRGRQAKEVA